LVLFFISCRTAHSFIPFGQQTALFANSVTQNDKEMHANEVLTTPLLITNTLIDEPKMMPVAYWLRIS
jgi:hypothetical protein